jgi:predicted ArsR family transcriptional regulator
VLEALQAATEPVTSAQVAEATGLAPSVVRHHLRRLREAGAVVEVDRSVGTGMRGRPARTWRVRPAVDVYAVASIASELARAQGAAVEDPATAAAITELGRQLAAAGDGDSLASIRQGLTRLGFAPRAVQGTDGAEQIVLDECPFVDPSCGVTDLAICRVHGMLTDGMAGPSRRVDHIDVDPTGRGCIIRLERVRNGVAAPRTGIDIRPVSEDGGAS